MLLKQGFLNLNGGKNLWLFFERRGQAQVDDTFYP